MFLNYIQCTVRGPFQDRLSKDIDRGVIIRRQDRIRESKYLGRDL